MKVSGQKIYGVYIRVSTEKQADDGDSIEMQENLAKEIIKEDGGVLYKIYSEPAVSATKTKLKDRKRLLECLSDAENGLFTHLIVYRRDRLARRTEDSLAIRSILEEAGCSLIFSARGEQQMVLNDPYGKLMENIHSSLAEIESAQTAIRVSDTLKDKARRGEFTGGNLPYGYETINKHLVPIESEKGIIKEVEDMYLNGFGIYSIIKWLEGEEVKGVGKRMTPATRKKQYKRSSSRWTKEVITSILFNPTYSGYMTYSYEGDKKKNKNSDTVINIKSDRITPMRSEETQNRINNIRNKKKSVLQAPRKYNTSFLLTGLLICKECGQEYRSRTSTRKDGSSYSYYICKGRDGRTVQTCTQSKNYKKEIIEQFVIEEAKKHIHQFLESDTYEILKGGLTETDNSLEKSLREVELQLKRTEKDFASLRRLLLDLDTEDDMYEMLRDTYQADQKTTLMKMNDLKKMKTELQEKLEFEIEKDYDMSEVIESLREFSEVIDFAPIHLQKQLIDKMFTSIEIGKDKQVTFNLALDLSTKPDKTTEVSFMSLGGVGDTTPTKSINVKFAEESFDSNVSEWVSHIISTIKSTFYDFLVLKNPKLSDVNYFVEQCELSEFAHKSYKSKRVFPTIVTMNKLLKVANSNIEEYAKHITNEEFAIEKKSIEVVLSNFGNGKGA